MKQVIIESALTITQKQTKHKKHTLGSEEVGNLQRSIHQVCPSSLCFGLKP